MTNPPARFGILLFSCAFAIALLPAHAGLSVADYGSIQEALDKNPGQMIFVPSGDYPISAAIRIHTDNSGLYGHGRIIQSDPASALIEVENAANVQIRDLTLTRAEGKMDANSTAVRAAGCKGITLQNLQILENRTRIPTVQILGSDYARILNCTVKNYMRISVDDRTSKPDWGFAFNVIDGTAMVVRDSKGALIQGNTILETEFVPTEELKAKYHLGDFCKKNPVKGTITLQVMWDTSYYNAWHQGSAIVIATAETDDYIQILGNYIENAAQGIDIHGDHVIMADNIINNSFMGMKAMHGSRNVIIAGNQFSRNDLWSIGMMPGASSHPAGVAARPEDDPAKAEANIDGHSIVAHNIISDFGYGTSAWMWKDATRSPLKFDIGQKDFNTPLTDVIIDGNVVYDTGRDKILKDGKPVIEPPHYNYAVCVSTGSGAPRGLRFSNNILDPGTQGVANVDIGH